MGALEQLAAVGVHLDIPVPPAIDNGGADSSDSSDDDDTGGGGGGGGGGVGSVAAPVADVRKRGRGGRGGGRAGAAPSRRGGGRGRYVNALLADAAAAAGDGALAVGAGVPAPPPVGVRLNIVALGGGVYGAPGAFVPDILVGAPDVEDPPAAPAAAGDGAPIVGPQRAPASNARAQVHSGLIDFQLFLSTTMSVNPYRSRRYSSCRRLRAQR